MVAKVFFLSSFALFLGQASASCVPLGWSYRNLTAWDSLGMCGHTDDQSPINIITSKVQDGVDLKPLDLQRGIWAPKGDLSHNEHTWQVDLLDSGAGIFWEGKSYKFVQFHFHSPSENTVDGRFYDMEMHLVHQNDEGRILVIAYFFEAQIGGTNPFLASFWHDFPTNDGVVTEKFVPAPYRSADLYRGHQPRGAYYSFVGSLTTPPCTNDTQWIVMKDPAPMSPEQLTTYRHGIEDTSCSQLAVEKDTPPGVGAPWDASIGINHRPTQPLGDRTVAEFEPKNTSPWMLAEVSEPSVAAICGLAMLSLALLGAVVAWVVRRQPPSDDNYVVLA